MMKGTSGLILLFLSTQRWHLIPMENNQKHSETASFEQICEKPPWTVSSHIQQQEHNTRKEHKGKRPLLSSAPMLSFHRFTLTLSIDSLGCKMELRNKLHMYKHLCVYKLCLKKMGICFKMCKTKQQ